MKRRSAPLLLLLLASACRTESKDQVHTGPIEPSPNASILPAPLASGDVEGKTDSSDAGALRDAGSDAGAFVVVTSREDRALDDDSELKEAFGFNFRARWRWLDVALPSRLPEANPDAVERARNQLDFTFDVALASAGRMRLTLAADSFALPRGTEFRARVELLGHAVVWPDGDRYSVLPEGALRAALNERRADVVPLTHNKPLALGDGDVLGLPTERAQVVTPLGKLELDQTRVPGSGYAGTPLCRFLLELSGADPETPLCAAELVPVRGEYTWAEGGRAAFEIVKWSRAATLDAGTLSVPPPHATFARGELPPAGPSLMLQAAELGRFRLRAVPRNERGDKREVPQVKEGLLVVNRGELAAYLLVDGVPVLRAAPRSEDVTLPLVPGTYSVQARDFLGSVNVAPSMISVPARVVLSDVADDR